MASAQHTSEKRAIPTLWIVAASLALLLLLGVGVLVLQGLLVSKSGLLRNEVIVESDFETNSERLARVNSVVPIQTSAEHDDRLVHTRRIPGLAPRSRRDHPAVGHRSVHPVFPAT